MMQHTLADLGHVRAYAKIGKLRHGKARIAARIDAGKGRQIHIDVQCEPVITAAAADAQSQSGDLGAGAINTRGARLSRGDDAVIAQRRDNRLLDAAYQFAHANSQPAQIEQQIDDQLPRRVIGHLATAIDADERDVARFVYVLKSSRLTQRENRRMLDQPKLVSGRFAARFGE